MKELNSTFVLYVKAFIWTVYDRVSGAVTINSGTRPQSKQTELYENYQKCLKTSTDLSLCTVAAKTLSSHGGFAIDFNVRIGSRTYGTPQIAGAGDAANRSDWNASLVPSIIKAIGHGLVWGGNWTGSSYDPIHIQWRPDGYDSWSDLYNNIDINGGKFSIKGTGDATTGEWEAVEGFDLRDPKGKKNEASVAKVIASAVAANQPSLVNPEADMSGFDMREE